jgi:urea transport system permease protein
VIPSIAFLIGVAIGGRATLLGPVLGAVGIAAAQSGLSSTFPSFWVYFQGLLFVLVIGFMPGGLASLPSLVGMRRKTSAPAPVPAAPAPPAAPATSPAGDEKATVPEEARR